MNNSNKVTGDIAELKVASAFCENGYFVARPLTDNAPYDLIVDNGLVLLKVQVKYRTTNRKNKIQIELRSCANKYQRHYKENDFDILAVYNPDCGVFVISWNEISNKKTIVFRITEPEQQKEKCRLVKNYKIKSIVS